jgi:hypothetical protein
LEKMVARAYNHTKPAKKQIAQKQGKAGQCNKNGKKQTVENSTRKMCCNNTNADKCQTSQQTPEVVVWGVWGTAELGARVGLATAGV